MVRLTPSIFAKYRRKHFLLQFAFAGVCLLVLLFVFRIVTTLAVTSHHAGPPVSSSSHEPSSRRDSPDRAISDLGGEHQSEELTNIVAPANGHTPTVLAWRVASSSSKEKGERDVDCAVSQRTKSKRVWERLRSRCSHCKPPPQSAEGLPFFCNDTEMAPWRGEGSSTSSGVASIGGGCRVPQDNPGACAVHAGLSFPPPYAFSQRPLPAGETVKDPPLPAAVVSYDSTATFAEWDKLTVIYSGLGQRFFGPGGQDYVLLAIEQWRKFHPPSLSNVFLIMDDNMTTLPEVRAAATQFSVEIVRRSEILTPQWQRYQRVFYRQGYMHPGGSRETGHKQFNQLVSERFFAVHALMKAKRLTHVLHFENDNLVYADMRPVVEAAARCGYQSASIFATLKTVIPGVLYIRHANAIGHIADFFNDFLSCGESYGRSFTTKWKDYANDMTYMMTYYELFGRSFLGALPAWEHLPGENCMFDWLLQRDEEMRRKKQQQSNLVNKNPLSLPAKKIFDLASFGQWYSFSPKDGQPPPQHVQNGIAGKLIKFTPELQWVQDEEGRRVPVWKDSYRLLSLHVHAKNLRKFMS